MRILDGEVESPSADLVARVPTDPAKLCEPFAEGCDVFDLVDTEQRRQRPPGLHTTDGRTATPPIGAPRGTRPCHQRQRFSPIYGCGANPVRSEGPDGIECRAFNDTPIGTAIRLLGPWRNQPEQRFQRVILCEARLRVIQLDPFEPRPIVLGKIGTIRAICRYRIVGFPRFER